MELKITDMVYKPREDSYMLAEQVKKYAKKAKKIIDIGTGCGIQAITAKLANPEAKVWACDLNPSAISATEKNAELNKVKIKVLLSDLFSVIHPHERFDLIIFNPPYLPSEFKPRNLQWSGGAELINKFLNQAKQHLTSNGKILFLFSSLTNLKGDFKIVTEKAMPDREKLFVGLVER